MPFPDFTPTVPELLHHAAERFGTHTYLVANGERLSYAEAVGRSAAVAKGLLAQGIGKGSRVGILVPNSVDKRQFQAPPRGKQARPTVGILYATIPAKGIDIAVAELERVRRHLSNLRVLAFGAELVGEVVQYGDSYRLCYVRGPDGIVVALAEQLSGAPERSA